MPGVPLSAKDAMVRIGTVTPAVLWARVWRIKPRTRWVPVPSFEGGGFTNYVACLRSCTLTLEFWYDADQNPYEIPIGMEDGFRISDLKLHLSGVTSPYWDIKKFNVEGPDHDADVEVEHKVVMNGMAEGAFFYPNADVLPLLAAAEVDRNPDLIEKLAARQQREAERIRNG